MLQTSLFIADSSVLLQHGSRKFRGYCTLHKKIRTRFCLHYSRPVCAHARFISVLLLPSAAALFCSAAELKLFRAARQPYFPIYGHCRKKENCGTLLKIFIYSFIQILKHLRPAHATQILKMASSMLLITVRDWPVNNMFKSVFAKTNCFLSGTSAVTNLRLKSIAVERGQKRRNSCCRTNIFKRF